MKVSQAAAAVEKFLLHSDFAVAKAAPLTVPILGRQHSHRPRPQRPRCPLAACPHHPSAHVGHGPVAPVASTEPLCEPRAADGHSLTRDPFLCNLRGNEQVCPSGWAGRGPGSCPGCGTPLGSGGRAGRAHVPHFRAVPLFYLLVSLRQTVGL